ncbi:hypothetical protein EYC84_009045 [Monilinia fructicola]|uniref:Uncharacterized protein n=1 Tax=Monilinia fructicola TaxID=38448 RepID=A0A5M9JDQ5_MONFR|nr:hypothetical protein EYC84_009045 [Monilinia fructicola]
MVRPFIEPRLMLQQSNRSRNMNVNYHVIYQPYESQDHTIHLTIIDLSRNKRSLVLSGLLKTFLLVLNFVLVSQKNKILLRTSTIQVAMALIIFSYPRSQSRNGRHVALNSHQIINHDL